MRQFNTLPEGRKRAGYGQHEVLQPSYELMHFLSALKGQKQLTQILSLQVKVTYYLREEKCQGWSVQISTHGTYSHTHWAGEGELVQFFALYNNLTHFLNANNSNDMVSTKFWMHWTISHTNIGFGKLMSIQIIPSRGLDDN
jgi:hypothetical protein